MRGKKIQVNPGDKFGERTVIRELERAGNGQRVFLMRCDCGSGEEKRVRLCDLRAKQSKRCAGCKATKAKPTGKPLDLHTYRAWASMRTRCLDSRSAAYPKHGGQGITVCEEWADFERFLSDMGKAPEHATLSRINNVGDYEPGNCRWDASCQRLLQ